MALDALPSELLLKGRKAEVDMSEPGLLVKDGTADNEFDLTSSTTDTPLGYTPSGLQAGQYEDVTVTVGTTVLLNIDGSCSAFDRLVPSGTTNGYITASDDPADTFIGYALQSASDGDEVKVLWLHRTRGPQRELTLSPGSEGDQVSDAFDIGLSQNLAEASKWMVRAFSQDGSRATNIQLSLQDGNGTEINSSGNDLLIFTLHTDGTETLRALDGSGSLSADVELVFTPLDTEGEAVHETLTYS